jgi:predicted XRE-type DNA-binding protein
LILITEDSKFYEGSGNVFADLGLEDADEFYSRAKIGFKICKILKEWKFKQRETAQILGIAQSDVSLLMNCKFNRFSTEKLLGFLKELDREMILMIDQKTPLDN